MTRPKEKQQIGNANIVCTFVMLFWGRYNEWRNGQAEVKIVSDDFKFETLVDVHSNIFEEYLSSVIAKLPKKNEDYHAIQLRIAELYEQYPKVLLVFDMDKPSDLTEQECKALIEILELRNKLSVVEMETVYFRGCYDSVGYLKKAGIL